MHTHTHTQQQHPSNKTYITPPQKNQAHAYLEDVFAINNTVISEEGGAAVFGEGGYLDTYLGVYTNHTNLVVCGFCGYMYIYVGICMCMCLAHGSAGVDSA